MPNVSVKIEGLSQLAELPGFLEEGQVKFVDRIGKRIAHAIEEASPKAGIPFEAEAVNSTAIRVVSRHPGAKALDKGAFIKGKGKKLRFMVGGKQVFTKHVRLKARKYTNKGLRKRNAIVREEFDKEFNHLGDL